jgi:shikimate kinase
MVSKGQNEQIYNAMANRRQSRANRILSQLDGRSVVFLGMMGCGKSAIGKMVARRLGLEFVDADTEIEVAAGRPVADIFEEYGEEEFRRLEEKVIERVLAEKPVLLALGGGAFMAEPTREIIEKYGLSVWIKADLNLLLERVGRRPGKRPLLSKGNPKEILEKLLKIREPVYALAELHIESKGGTKSDMRNVVMDALDEHLKVPE